MKNVTEKKINTDKHGLAEPSETRYKSLFLTVIISALSFSILAAQDFSLEERVDAIFTQIDSDSLPGCAVSVIKSAETVYENAYGMANLEYGIPLTPGSVFHVASVSKQFTALAVQLLVNEGKASWDDDIRDYVPEVPDFENTITLRHLVHHVSGLRDQWSLLSKAGWRWESDVVTQEDVLEITSRQTALNFEPGSRYLYSNTGYTLLAVVIERVSGQTLREFTSERIFRPLGMEHTHFQDDHRRIVRNRAWAYEPHREGTFGFRNSVPVFNVTGASSLFTTVRDLAAWDRNFYTGEIGGPDSLQKMHERFVLTTGDTISYASGMIVDEYLGLKTVSHGGADAGYRSSFFRFPQQEFSVSVLCNFPSSNPDGIARRIAHIYLEDELQNPEIEFRSSHNRQTAEITISEEELRKLQGYYITQPGDRSRSIRFRNNILVLEMGPGIPLRPIGNDVFEVGGSGIEVTIQASDGTSPGTLSFPGDSEPDIYQRVDFWSPAKEDLDAIAGSYYSDELGTEYRFTVEDNTLRFHHRKLESRLLRPAFTDAFFMGGRTIVFTRNAEDEIDGFRISDSRVWGVRFERM